MDTQTAQKRKYTHRQQKGAHVTIPATERLKPLVFVGLSKTRTWQIATVNGQTMLVGMMK